MSLEQSQASRKMVLTVRPHGPRSTSLGGASVSPYARKRHATRPNTLRTRLQDPLKAYNRTRKEALAASPSPSNNKMALSGGWDPSNHAKVAGQPINNRSL